MIFYFINFSDKCIGTQYKQVIKISLRSGIDDLVYIGKSGGPGGYGKKFIQHLQSSPFSILHHVVGHHLAKKSDLKVYFGKI